jgi:hypothetical protein
MGRALEQEVPKPERQEEPKQEQPGEPKRGQQEEPMQEQREVCKQPVQGQGQRVHRHFAFSCTLRTTELH